MIPEPCYGPRVAAEPEGSRDGSPVRAKGPVTGSRSAAETMTVDLGMSHGPA